MGRKALPPITQLSKKQEAVLTYYLTDIQRDKDEAYLTQFKSKDVFGGMNRLLASLPAKRFITEHIDEILNREGLYDLQGRVITRLTNVLMTDDRHIKAGDVAKVASVLARICGWDTTQLTMNVPQLEILITNEAEPTNAVTTTNDIPSSTNAE